MSFAYTPIAQFEKTSFTATAQTGNAITHDIYTLGKGEARSYSIFFYAIEIKRK